MSIIVPILLFLGTIVVVIVVLAAVVRPTRRRSIKVFRSSTIVVVIVVLAAVVRPTRRRSIEVFRSSRIRKGRGSLRAGGSVSLIIPILSCGASGIVFDISLMLIPIRRGRS